jgi:hypothetical protein
MNTNEMVKRIDELIRMGEKVKAGDANDRFDGMKGFCHGVKVLIEEIHGFGNQLSARFGAIEGYNLEEVEEGISVLKDLRKLILYAGEYGC